MAGRFRKKVCLSFWLNIIGILGIISTDIIPAPSEASVHRKAYHVCLQTWYNIDSGGDVQIQYEKTGKNMQARLTELNENEILLYLGYRGQEYPKELEAQIKRCMEKVIAEAQPRLIWRRLPVNGADFSALPLTGKDIWEHLEGCWEAVLMAVTLGQGIDRLLTRSCVSNMADAVIIDACASTAIENVADNFEMDLRRKVEAERLYLTDRFSPGYGDLPISVQKQFCAVLDTERKIGLSVSPSMLLMPGKSVTAVLGISDMPKPLRKRGCESCRLFRSCIYRKEGRNCHGE